VRYRIILRIATPEGRSMTTLTSTHRPDRGHPVPSPPVPPTPTRVALAMRRLASVRVWAATAAGYGVFAAVFFATGAAFSIPTVQRLCGQAPPDMRFGPSAAEVHGFLAACGTSGREAYTALQVADLLYPLVFATFLASSLAIVLRHLFPGRPNLLTLAAVPFVAGAFDYLENVAAWLALSAWPAPGVADGLFGLASVAKTATSWASGILLVVAVALFVVRWLRAAGGRWPRARRAAGGPA
jgi:hypothetical protein